jgi:uncharacterized protein YkwD
MSMPLSGLRTRSTSSAGRVTALLLVAAACAAAADAQMRRPELPSVVQQIIETTNALRRGHGLAEVVADARLTRAARDFAEFMARTDRYGHEADSRKPAERANAAGYRYCIISENLGYQESSIGFTSGELARRLVDAWYESPGHRRNLLHPQVTAIGVGVAGSERSGRYYAVQMFALPESAATEFAISNRAATTVNYELGGRSFSLPPLVTRTHKGCLEGELRVLLPDGPPGPAISPTDGARYAVVRDQAGQLRLQSQ